MLISPEALHRSRILAYWRCMDDGLVLGEGPRLPQYQFFSSVADKAEASCFSFKVDSVSADACVFLDPRLSKEVRFRTTGRVDIQIHRKPTSLAQPLNPTSFQP